MVRPGALSAWESPQVAEVGAEELNELEGPGTCEEEHTHCSYNETRGYRAPIWLVEESLVHWVERLVVAQVQMSTAVWFYRVLCMHRRYPLHMEVARNSSWNRAGQRVSNKPAHT